MEMHTTVLSQEIRQIMMVEQYTAEMHTIVPLLETKQQKTVEQ